MRWRFVLAAIALAACATRQPSAAPRVVSAAELVDRAGDSLETAVTVPADAPNDGIDFQNNWMYDRFGRFRRLKWGIAHDANRRYEVITIELPDHSEHTVYFDITDNWNNWKPPH